MAYVVLTHDTNEDGHEASTIFRTIFKNMASARAAIIEEESYMLDEDEAPDLEWNDDNQAFGFNGDILYQIIEVEIEK